MHKIIEKSVTAINQLDTTKGLVFAVIVVGMMGGIVAIAALLGKL